MSTPATSKRQIRLRSHFIVSERLVTISLYMMVGVAFVLRIVNMSSESLWRDEVDTIRFAFMPMEQLIANLARTGFNGPLYTLAVRGWLSLTGINDFALRFLSLIFGVLQIPLIYAFSRRLFGRRAALYTTWLAVLAPVLIWYGAEGKMYSLQPALLLLALYALRRAIASKSAFSAIPLVERIHNLRTHFNVWWIIFVIAVSCAYYVHLLSPIFVAVAVVFFGLWWQLSHRHLIGAISALALCTVPYIPLAVWQMPVLINGLVTGHDRVALDEIFNSLLTNWSVGISQQQPAVLNLLAMLLFVDAACLGLWAASIPKPASKENTSNTNVLTTADVLRFRSAIGVLVWLASPPLLVFIISQRAPIFEPRYLLWCAPALYVLAGAGIAWMVQSVRVIGITLYIMLMLCSASGFIYQVAYPIRPDVRGAAKHLARHLAADDLVFFQIPYTRYGFLYYLPRFVTDLPFDRQPQRSDGLVSIQGIRERFLDAPYTNNQSTPDDIIAYLAPLVGDTRRVWYIEAEAEMWDSHSMGRAWFETNMIAVDRSNFRNIRVTRYEKP